MKLTLGGRSGTINSANRVIRRFFISRRKHNYNPTLWVMNPRSNPSVGRKRSPSHGSHLGLVVGSLRFKSLRTGPPERKSPHRNRGEAFSQIIRCSQHRQPQFTIGKPWGQLTIRSLAMYRYTCVGCKQQTKLAYNERKSPWLCRDCCQLRNWILGKIRGNTIKLKMRLIFERGQRCENCGTEVEHDRDLIAHHVTPVASFGESAPDNIKLLCKPCHNDVHGTGKGNQWTGYQVVVAYLNGELSFQGQTND